MRTIIEFDLIRDYEGYIVDPKSIFINGYFNWNTIQDFLFSNNCEYMNELGERMNNEGRNSFKLEIWEDSDDYRSWICYDILEIN